MQTEEYWNDVDRFRRDMFGSENQRVSVVIPCDAGFVYVFGYGDGKRYKIGQTLNLVNRLKQYQTAYPDAVRFDVTVFTLNRLALEDELKARFTAQRIRGEWYTLTPDDLAYIAALGK